MNDILTAGIMKFNYVMRKITIYTSQDVDCVSITHFSCLMLLKKIFFSLTTRESINNLCGQILDCLSQIGSHIYTVVTPRQTQLYQARFRLYAVQCTNDEIYGEGGGDLSKSENYKFERINSGGRWKHPRIL
jgi:hypothetical protein